MKLIKKPMTLEQYEAKYPHYQTKLISFSDNEIKEFNNKFYKNNGNKNIPDKYALLNKYKWVHIKDRYYQIPRVSKLGKVGIALGGAAAVAGAVVLPILLNNGVKLNAEEFMNSITYISTYSKDRKYVSKGTMDMGDMSNKGSTVDFVTEVDGINLKLGSYNESGEVEYDYYTHDEDGNFFRQTENWFTGEKTWLRVTSGTSLDVAFIPYNELAKNYDKFKKINKDTWEIKDFNFTYSYEGFPLPITTSYQFSFNTDKTLKAAKGTFEVNMSALNNLGYSSEEGPKVSVDATFSDVKTHTITDMPSFKKPISEDMPIYWDDEEEEYVNEYDDDDELKPFNIAKGYNEKFYFTVATSAQTTALQINRFAIYASEDYSSEPELINITKDNIVSICSNGVEITSGFSVKNNIIEFDPSIGEMGKDIEITMNFKQSYEYAYAHAYEKTSQNVAQANFVIA